LARKSWQTTRGARRILPALTGHCKRVRPNYGSTLNKYQIKTRSQRDKRISKLQRRKRKRGDQKPESLMELSIRNLPIPRLKGSG